MDASALLDTLLGKLQLDNIDVNSLTVGEIRRAIPLPDKNAIPPDDPEDLLKMIGDLMEQCAIRQEAQIKLADLLAEQKAENESLRGRLKRLTMQTGD
jgi:uncharacterized Zn finger protein